MDEAQNRNYGRSGEQASAIYWRNRICSALPGLTIDWLEDGPIRARLETRRFADGWIVEGVDPPLRVGRRVPPGGKDGGYQLVWHLAGHGRYRYSGRDLLQEPGDFVLLDTALPFDVVHPAGTHAVIWNLPREILAPLLAAPDRGAACHIRGADGMGAVLGSYARTLMDQAGRIDASAQHGLRGHLCGLVALALGASRTSRESHRQTYRAVRRQQILAYMEAHLRDNRLTAERAAHDLQMSRRWLHALLRDGEISFAGWVVGRRLEECRTLLDDPVYDHLSVAEIAFLSGFNDLSTFYRQFRKRYQMTPRDARHARGYPSARSDRNRCA